MTEKEFEGKLAQLTRELKDRDSQLRLARKTFEEILSAQYMDDIINLASMGIDNITVLP